MAFLASLPIHDLTKFLHIMEDSLKLRRHKDLFRWLHDGLQDFLPHEILIAAWGDFDAGLVNLDVISYLPGMRTTEIDRRDLLPLLVELFGRWQERDRGAFTMPIEEGTIGFKGGEPETALETAFTNMRSALIHGIKDERGRHDCLYVVLGRGAKVDTRALRSMEVLLPYIDAALRQVPHLPVQCPDTQNSKQGGAGESAGQDCALVIDDLGLSEREREILRWVAMGKTNLEIGAILDISSFTVKNHLQRIFRKINVMNRAQAVAKFERVWMQGNGQ